ncbi:MAG: sensor domain-containing diguanylate cyclase [Gammaproteobacteria bacterium]|nr:sensor domain-containing diguanylate cyclase [Gammaproteobacteria bacterium]
MSDHEPLIEKLQNQITALKEKLAQSNNAFFNIIGKNRDGILIFDTTGKVIYANPAALDLFGKDLGELLGEKMGIFMENEHKTEITIIHKDRGPISIEVNMADTLWNNHIAKLASLRDVTEHKKTKLFLERLSHFDYLTDLANRVYFEDTLKRSIARAKRMNTKIALLLLDMDGFKQVNDTYGHQIGDKLLVHTALVLKSSVRAEDVVARLGGDEFAIVLERVEKFSICEKIANKILTIIKKPIHIDHHPIHVNFSIGIALYPDHALSIEELIKKADKAMYAAKNAGRGQYQISAV